MDAMMIARFRALVEKPEVPSDEEKAEMLAALRVEEFWSGRAPALNDEVVHLRQVETHARALRAALATAAAPADGIADALNELDSWRMNRPEA